MLGEHVKLQDFGGFAGDLDTVEGLTGALCDAERFRPDFAQQRQNVGLYDVARTRDHVPRCHAAAGATTPTTLTLTNDCAVVAVAVRQYDPADARQTNKRKYLESNTALIVFKDGQPGARCARLVAPD